MPRNLRAFPLTTLPCPSSPSSFRNFFMPSRISLPKRQSAQSDFSRLRVALAAGVMVLAILSAPGAHAVKPQTWTHETQADFDKGDSQGVLVTDLGRVTLASDLETVVELPEDVSIVYDTAVEGETTYVLTGPSARLLQIQDGEITGDLAWPGQAFASRWSKAHQLSRSAAWSRAWFVWILKLRTAQPCRSFRCRCVISGTYWC